MGADRRKDSRNNVPAARELRRRLTPAETVLWDALWDRRLDGFKFRRQHPVGPFVLDFCCPAHRLAVEVDGPIHDQQRDQDTARDELLTTAGYSMLRLSNHEIQTDFPAALARIRSALTPNSSPAHQERGDTVQREKGRG